LALALLLAFTLVRGGIWAVTQPYFWAPDEDYHFLYVEHLTTQGALPSPDEPLYPREYRIVLQAMKYDQYSSGPRQDFSGDPKASVRRLEGLSDADREPSEVNRGVTVVHAPVYYVAGAVVNGLLGDASPFTRIAAVRWMSSLIGVLAVYLAWLLAGQVFRREWLTLTAAALVALQPMIGFLSGIVSNDIAVTAGYTAALALSLFILRTSPRIAQGAWLGGAIGLALLLKSTAVGLVPLALLAYAGQALVWKEERHEVVRSAALALGVVATVAGWWYVRSLIVYGSLLGSTTEVVPAGEGGQAGLGSVVNLTWEWTRLTYRTYWWHFFAREAPNGSAAFYAPFAIVAMSMLGLLWASIARLRGGALLARADPLLRQTVLMVAAVMILYLPPLATDILRRFNGEGFALVAGRFLLPAYPAVVVLVLIGLRQLVPRRLFAWACGALVGLAAVFYWTVYWDTHVHRYFGDAAWGELFRRMSFDRPGIVTEATIWIALAAILVTFAGFVAVVLSRSVRPRHGGA
jgi:4-amino-4-deoxy-L-arabinose transferase-like glycosyltransferase